MEYVAGGRIIGRVTRISGAFATIRPRSPTTERLDLQIPGNRKLSGYSRLGEEHLLFRKFEIGFLAGAAGFSF